MYNKKGICFENLLKRSNLVRKLQSSWRWYEALVCFFFSIKTCYNFSHEISMIIRFFKLQP